jgi:hypothetical protein
MAANVFRRACWGFLTVGFVLLCGISSLAQDGLAARDLNSTLSELSRVVPATVQDLDLANQDHGGLIHRITFWRGNKAYDPQIVEALRRNLQFAVPNLIHDTQASGGSISASFKLYRDLSVVCESLSTLLPPGSHESKGDLSALNNDLTDMNRLREELASYVVRAAAAMDSRNPQMFTSAGRPFKRVIVDNNMPESRSPRKRRSSNQ